MNPFRGEAVLSVGDETYALRLDVNAIVLAEDALDTNLTDLIGKLTGQVRLGIVRALLWASLQHLPKPPNLLRVGEIISEAGITAAREAVLKAVTSAMPKAEPKVGDDVDPPKAAGGIGSGSSDAGAV